MDLSLIFIAVIAIVLIGFGKSLFSGGGGRTDAELKYQKLGHLFSSAEKSFLSVLSLAVDEGQVVFGKVRVADVITPKKGETRSRWQTAFNKISAKHFDYVICDSNTLAPLIAIELNDSSHLSRKVKDRDTFLANACQSARFPLLFIKAAAEYQVEEVKRQILDSINSTSRDCPVEQKSHIETQQVKTELCPECGMELVEKLAKRGRNKDKFFLGCSGFPNCRYLVPRKKP